MLFLCSSLGISWIRRKLFANSFCGSRCIMTSPRSRNVKFHLHAKIAGIICETHFNHARRYSIKLFQFRHSFARANYEPGGRGYASNTGNKIDCYDCVNPLNKAAPYRVEKCFLSNTAIQKYFKAPRLLRYKVLL